MGMFKHGHYKNSSPTRLLRYIWRSMIQRCTDKDFKTYRHYGGRGVSICNRWLESFEAFMDDVGPRPSRKHSLDRIDNSGNYEPGNVRWATRTEQLRNTRRTRLLTFGGETHCLSAWSEKLGIDKRTIHSRLKAGWTVEQALGLEARG